MASMFTHRILGASLLLLLVSLHVPAMAVVTTVVLTNDDASGVAGGKFDSLVGAALNESGQLVFTGQLQSGLGGVDSSSDAGVWLFDGSITTLRHWKRWCSGNYRCQFL